MRALLLAACLFGTCLLAVLVQERWRARLMLERDLGRSQPALASGLGEDWSTLLIGGPSGVEPLAFPEKGWASPVDSTEMAQDALPLSAEAEITGPAAEASELEREYAPDFVYRVQQKDTLGKICEQHYGTSKQSLVEAVALYNGLTSVNAIRAGALLYLPDSGRF